MRTFILIMTGLALCLLAAFADEAPTQTGPIVVPGQGPNPATPAENPALAGPIEIPSQDPPPADVVAWLHANLNFHISTDKEEYVEDEPIILTAILENRGDRPVVMKYVWPYFGPLMSLSVAPKDWDQYKARWGSGIAENPIATLYHGAYFGAQTNLTVTYIVPPGDYRVKARLRISLKQEEDISLASNEIHIVVKAKPVKPPEPGQEEKIKQLIKDLGSEDWETREKASEELIKIGEPAIEPLLAVAKEAADPEVVWRAQIILKELGYTTDETIAEKVQAILDGIKENDWTVKETIGIEIVRLGPRVIGTLKSFLDNPDYRIRQVVVELLGKIPDKQIVQVLINALDDKDKYVAASAAKELRRISGQTFTSFEKDKWQAWWDANKATFHLPELPPEQD